MKIRPVGDNEFREDWEKEERQTDMTKAIFGFSSFQERTLKKKLISHSTQTEIHFSVAFYPDWCFSTLSEVFLHWLRFFLTWQRISLPWLRFFYTDWGFPTLTEIFLHWLTFFLPWLRFFFTLTEVFLYPDCGFSVLFPQLQGKCQGITRKDGAQPALSPIRR